MPISQEFTDRFPDPARLSKAARCGRVSLKDLSLPRDLFAVGCAPALDASALIVPLVVVAKENGSFEIVDGCKRYTMLAGGNTAPDCSCSIIDETLSETSAGLLRIMLNRNRPLFVAEQLLFYKWLLSRMPAFETAEAADLLNLPWKIAKELETLVMSPQDVIDTVCNKRIHLQNAGDLSRLTNEDRASVLEFFDGLGLSQQVEHEFLQWLPEISSNLGVEIKDVLSNAELMAARNDPLPNGPQKIERLRRCIHSLRYPRFSSALNRWNALSGKANPDPSAVRFVCDPFFEKDRLEIRIAVSSPDKIKEITARLSDIPRTTWRELIHPSDESEAQHFGL